MAEAACCYEWPRNFPTAGDKHPYSTHSQVMQKTNEGLGKHFFLDFLYHNFSESTAKEGGHAVHQFQQAQLLSPQPEDDFTLPFSHLFLVHVPKVS